MGELEHDTRRGAAHRALVAAHDRRAHRRDRACRRRRRAPLRADAWLTDTLPQDWPRCGMGPWVDGWRRQFYADGWAVPRLADLAGRPRPRRRGQQGRQRGAGGGPGAGAVQPRDRAHDRRHAHGARVARSAAAPAARPRPWPGGVVPAVQRAGQRQRSGVALVPGGAGRHRPGSCAARRCGRRSRRRRRGACCSPAPTRRARSGEGITAFAVPMVSRGVTVRPLRQMTGDAGLLRGLPRRRQSSTTPTASARSTRAGESPGRRWPRSEGRSAAQGASPVARVGGIDVDQLRCRRRRPQRRRTRPARRGVGPRPGRRAR